MFPAYHTQSCDADGLPVTTPVKKCALGHFEVKVDKTIRMAIVEVHGYLDNQDLVY